jgi:hypothetical protein
MMEHITPIMLVIGVCSMNEGFMPFKANIGGLIIVIALVFVLFTMLQRAVPSSHEHSQRWQKVTERVKRWFGRISLAARRPAADLPPPAISPGSSV